MNETTNDRRHRWFGGISVLVVALFGFPIEGMASDPDPVPEEVSYARDVNTEIEENCAMWHRQGSIGPMSLQTYDEVRPWAQVITLKVESRMMPPRPAARTIGIPAF